MLQKPRVASSRELLSRLEKLDRRNVLDRLKTGAQIQAEGVVKIRHSDPAPTASPHELSPIVYKRDLPREEPHIRLSPTPERNVVLEEVIAGKVVDVSGLGRTYLAECFPCDEIDTIRQLPSEFAACLQEPESNMRKLLASRFRELDDLAAEDFLFIDLETTGLGSCPLFLIGTMEWESNALVVRQYLARTYAEEAAAIGLFLQRTSNRKLLVSFNGKSFDIPFVRMRAAANGIRCELPAHHLDLLHQSRRVYKGVLPDCRLQTLELHICKRGRYGDIPGAEIPDAYHEFVRSANAIKVVEILKHNMLDMVTLAELMVRMPTPTTVQTTSRPRKRRARRSAPPASTETAESVAAAVGPARQS